LRRIKRAERDLNCPFGFDRDKLKQIGMSGTISFADSIHQLTKAKIYFHKELKIILAICE
jgi:hypothetical protein